MDVYVKDGDEYTPLSEDYKVLSNDDLSVGYISKDKFGPAVQNKVDERFKNHVHRDKVFEDEVLVARFKEKYGTSEPSVDLDAQREQWTTANLKPVQSELEQTREQLSGLTSKLKHVEIERAFGSRFDDTFIKRIDPKKPSTAELLYGDQIDFDYNTSTISVRGSEMSVEDFVGELVADPRLKDYLREPERNSTRAKIGQEGKGVTKSGHKPKTRDDIQDHGAYIRQYGLRQPKVEGWPAYMKLK